MICGGRLGGRWGGAGREVVWSKSRETQVMTDSARMYIDMNKDGWFSSHDRVDHSKEEWARYEEGRPEIQTNTVEGYFSVLKRGMRGTHQHCKERHLHRYLSEFEFRYNKRAALGVSDQEWATKALEGIKGKRLKKPLSTSPASVGGLSPKGSARAFFELSCATTKTLTMPKTLIVISFFFRLFPCTTNRFVVQVRAFVIPCTTNMIVVQGGR